MDCFNQSSFDECHCPCHTTMTNMSHVMPCCGECPTCKKDIKTSAYKRHVAECAKAKAKEELKGELGEKLKELLNKQPRTG